MVEAVDHSETLLAELLNRVRANASLSDLLGPDVDPIEVSSLLSPISRSVAAATWVGVNGPRVDVILSAEGDEWRVVFGSEDHQQVDWLVVYHRPPFFAGVPGGRAVGTRPHRSRLATWQQSEPWLAPATSWP
jgi:hypothetical protein